MSDTLLIVDDNPDSLFTLEQIALSSGYAVVTAVDGRQALERAREVNPDLILLDVMLPEYSGLEVAEELKTDPALRYTPVILVSARDSLTDVTEGLDCGVCDYITKPFRAEELLARVRAALRLKSRYESMIEGESHQSSQLLAFGEIIGESVAMKRVFHLMERVVESDSPVLITGPSGTGKELVARAIHQHSLRSERVFLARNCAAFNENLLESELFGHVRGAFTGAIAARKGVFEAAHRGTLFLDEVGEMSPSLQAKLLRVLQEGVFTAVGGLEERECDVRVIAATNRDVNAMVEKGTFREDLYYRLNVINISLPPLSERREDIPLLVRHFLQRYPVPAGRTQRERFFTPEAMAALQEYSWRGNVRELENEIERVVTLSGKVAQLGKELLSPRIVERANQEDGGELRRALEGVERSAIQASLRKNGWNKSAVARELGISRSNLITKIRRHGLEKKG